MEWEASLPHEKEVKVKGNSMTQNVTTHRLNGLRLVLRATGGIAICQVIRRQVRKEECNV